MEKKNVVLTDIMIESQFDAGTKARNDVLAILTKAGFEPIVMFNRSHNNILRLWETFCAMRKMSRDGKNTQYVVLQYPYHAAIMKIFFHYFLKMRKGYGTKLILLIHDILYLRDEVKQQANDEGTKAREVGLFNSADQIIVHNPAMKEKLIADGVTAPMTDLGVFDYLGKGEKSTISREDRTKIVFAGNLKPEKSAFLYDTKEDFGVDFHLYGTKPDDLSSCFSYKGSFPPNELIEKMEGNYGLVWDGNSTNTCNGMYGEYLRYNAPHKCSLYLAAGFPVVIWKEAALAKFVEENNVGRTISDFSQLRDLPSVGSQEYAKMLKNVERVSARIQKGEMLKMAIEACVGKKTERTEMMIPQGFLEEEVRCDYLVTQTMKKVWATEIDLLVRLLDVCKRHGLWICACGGTLLGAVRHKGFIPWDDDVDMMMPREDYEKLCRIAEEEFSYPYFFQTEYTENGTMRGHAQLRNSLTTAIVESERGKAAFNQGIFIDIFPFDAVTDDAEKLKRQSKKVRSFKRLLKFTRQSVGYNKNAKGLRGLAKKTIYWLLSPLRWLKVNEKTYRRFEEECARYNGEQSEKFGLLSFDFDDEKQRKRWEDYAELIEMPFEFITVPVPKNYERSLSEEFGDWHRFVRGTTCHGGVFFDPDKCYKEYI